MMPPDAQQPTDAAFERLLSEIFLRVRQGRLSEASERLAKAKELAPGHPRVIELEGDLAFAQHRFSTAQKLYKSALELDPKNTKLEEKYATAVLKVHMPEFLAHTVPDDSPWSNRIPRLPIISTLQSALVPGLGQLYNGDWLKGLGIFFVFLLCGLALLRHVVNELYAAKSTMASLTVAQFIGEAIHGPQLFLTLIIVVVWVFAVIDAWLVAKSTT